MYGLESLNLGTAKPAGSEHLQMQPLGAMFDASDQCIKVSRGSVVNFTYNLANPRDINFSLQFQLSGTARAGTKWISIKVNNVEVAADCQPKEASRQRKTWFIPLQVTKVGLNQFSITTLGNGSMGIDLFEVSIGSFEIEQQQQTNWCWDATALSVAKYYDRTNVVMRQCELYRLTYPRVPENPCDVGYRRASGEMNKTGWPAGPLNILGHLKQDHPDQLKWEELLAEMDACRPVICTLDWKEGGGHAVVVSGARIFDKKRWVLVEDPMSGTRNRMTFETFQSAYKQAGDNWKCSILSKPKA